jgi:hypothetical protein
VLVRAAGDVELVGTDELGWSAIRGIDHRAEPIMDIARIQQAGQEVILGLSVPLVEQVPEVVVKPNTRVRSRKGLQTNDERRRQCRAVSSFVHDDVPSLLYSLWIQTSARL